MLSINALRYLRRQVFLQVCYYFFFNLRTRRDSCPVVKVHYTFAAIWFTAMFGILTPRTTAKAQENGTPDMPGSFSAQELSNMHPGQSVVDTEAVNEGKSNNKMQSKQTAVQKIFNMRTKLSKLRSDISKIGGNADTKSLRNSIILQMSNLQNDAKSIKDLLLRLAENGCSRESSKIVADFESTLKDFKTLMSVAKSKESSLPAIQHKVGQANSPDAVQQMMQIDAIPQQEISINEAFIDERDQGITEIQQQIYEVNYIFQDIAVLVDDQGSQLNDIEANIAQTTETADGAHQQLLHAYSSKKLARKRMFIAIIILIFILTFLTIILM